MLTDRIGIDLGNAAATADAGKAIAALGARSVRVTFPLSGHARADEAYLTAARDAVKALADEHVGVIVVVDGEMTVAPGGLGTFADPPVDERLAAAWCEELVGNVSRLAERLGDLVLAWEVLPEPNAGTEPLIAPSRWLVLVEAVARTLREASPLTTIVAGGLLSEADDDGVDYLRAALLSLRRTDETDAVLPFDSIAIRLRVLAEGGASEDAVAAALSERVQRLWRVLENHEGSAAATERGIWVTGISWDVNACGEDVQGRNAWTAFNTLTAEPLVRLVFWSTLQDEATAGGAGTGLFRDASWAETSQRPAWKAVFDFSEYARLITPAATAASLLLDPTPAEDGAMEEIALDPVPAVDVEDHDAAGVVAETDVDTEAERTYVFRIPGAAEILRGQGIDGEELRAVLAAVTKKYGGNQWLPPGEYDVQVPTTSGAPLGAATYTNQHVISAMYRAGGGTWELLERSGLSLSDLAASRHEPYHGPIVDEMSGLDEDERTRVLQELSSLASAED